MINLFLSIIRALFALIDKIVVWLIKNLYILLIQIASTNVFGDFIYQMLGRIYVFLGLFMVFKLSMSMITYIINPDAMTDKGKGFGKLITNVVISLILVVTVPTLFKEAFRLQSTILNSNAIYQIITGRSLANDPSSNDSDVIKNAEKIGDQIAYGVFSSFVYRYSSTDSVNGSFGPPVTEEDTEGAIQKNGEYVCNGMTAACLVDVDTVTYDGNGENGFANEYKFLLSTICGAVVAYFFLVFCLDASTRAIKLGVLQIIAPIPILSMMDPKTGNEKLKKWASVCGKEYAGLFIRLAGVFFAVEIISTVLNGQVEGAMTYYDPSGGYGRSVKSIFVRLFIILGCLMFAKQLPQFIENVLGVKLSGGDGFNLKKRLGSIPGLGIAKAAGAGALGFAGGMAANALATKGNWKGQGFKNGLKNVGSILGGGFSAGARGMTSKDKNMFKAAGAGVKKSVDARELRDKRQEAGYGFGTRMMDNVYAFAGVDGEAKKRSDELHGSITNLQRQQAQYDRIAQEVALKRNLSPEDITRLSGATVEVDTSNNTRTIRYADGGTSTYSMSDAVGQDYESYINAVNKSNETNIKIVKETKKLKLYQKEDKSKG